MHDARSRAIRRGLVVAAAAAVVLAVGVIALRSRSGPASTSNDLAASGAPEFLALEPPGSASASPIPPDASTPRAQVLGKTNVAEAIAVARPLMTNTSGRLDTGSALLSLWATDRLTWEALESLPETSAALFRRDPEAERGKRLCMSGTIVEIRAEKTLAGRLAEDRALPLIEPPAPSVHTDPATHIDGG